MRFHVSQHEQAGRDLSWEEELPDLLPSPVLGVSPRVFKSILERAVHMRP